MSKGEKEPEVTPTVKWEKPKILLMDLPESVGLALNAEGYNVTVGTFGTPYKVEMNGGYSPLLVKGNLPNFSEQEIIVVDLADSDPTDSPQGEPDRSPDQLDWWVQHTVPTVDPRPCLMMSVQRQLDRIINHGGLLVVFSLPRNANNFVWARKPPYNALMVEEKLNYDNWSFSSLFDNNLLVIKSDSGEELKADEGHNPVSAFFRRHANQMRYFATFAPRYGLSSDSEGYSFLPLVKTKFGVAAGGVIADSKKKGWIFILPQCSDRQKEYLLIDLLQNVATEIARHLFPHLEGGRWVQGAEYEHPAVLVLKTRQDTIRSDAKSQIKTLDEQIAFEREKLSYLHGILTKKGTPLVKDVKSALEMLGFAHVIDVDEQQDEGAAKQEDLQIHNQSPTLLIEVKGLAGFPREGDTIQVVKYIPRRMKEWGRTDVSGVLIVNHQCNLPALERDHDRVFTDQQVEDAGLHDVTLVTTWELFRLLRARQRWNWPPEAVRALFYGKGRIAQAPSNYKKVGVITHFYDKASVVSIKIDDGEEIRVGATLGYILRDQYFQETVESMQLEKVNVAAAIGGQLVGHKTSLPRSALPDGTHVYVVS